MKKAGNKILGGKGFYVALAVSAVAVGAVAYLTVTRFNQAMEPPKQENSTIQNSSEWVVPEIEDANNSQTGVPKGENFIVSSTPESTASVSEPETTASEPVEETPVTKPADPPAPTSKGAYIMPLTGEIVNPFSGGELVKSKTLGEWRTHDGIDIKAAEGTPVKSIYDGIVKDIRVDKKWGVTVEVEYPECVAYYYGLADTVKVKKGAEVKLGDVLGEVGNTSVVESTEDFHLHLAVKKDKEWIDPMSIITKN